MWPLKLASKRLAKGSYCQNLMVLQKDLRSRVLGAPDPRPGRTRRILVQTYAPEKHGLNLLFLIKHYAPMVFQLYEKTGLMIDREVELLSFAEITGNLKDYGQNFRIGMNACGRNNY